MQKLQERKSLSIKQLAVVLLVVLGCILPQAMLFRKLCMEQDRNIPPNTEVLVSSCKRPSAIGVPGGEVLFVYERSTNKIYLLDLRTGEKRDVPNDPLFRNIYYGYDRVVFLSPELVWLHSMGYPGDFGYRPHYILDLTNGQRYELLDLTWLPRSKDGMLHPDNYAYIQSAENIFIHPSENELIALSTNFRTNQNGRVIFTGLIITTDNNDHKVLEKLMRSWGMDYENVDLSLDYTDVPSPTGKYVARDDGIYLSTTNEQVVGAPGYFKSWYYDESGVVVQKWITSWIRSPFIGAHYDLYNPILKLRLPTQ